MFPVLEAIEAAVAARRTACLLRHADREAIDDPLLGHDTPLTEAGRIAARTLGERVGALLAGPGSVVVAHSPVPRCADTAQMVMAGLSAYGHRLRFAGDLGFLGGPYLVHHTRALSLARDLGPDYLRHWFAGSIDENIVQPLAQAARGQVRGALDAIGDADLALLVTHDWNVMLLREHYLGVRHEEEGWIDYLDGVAISVEPERLRFLYRGLASEPVMVSAI